MILEEHFTLANGVNIPKLGLGTWRIDDSTAAQVVQDAIHVGYRHIDTAQPMRTSAASARACARAASRETRCS
jgi:Aldo/keto reductases, related to diketogulonate reductase